jgi:WD40 repeat protein/serine/threonine protein kinase
MPAEPTREEELFHEALELPPGQDRTAFLQKACAGDKTLRQGIEALLRAHAEAGTTLEPLVPRRFPESATEPITEKPGDRIGRYKLLQEIGEGGMGSVWMAAQEEPVRRRVALKVVKLGMDTRHVIARFEAERQALALMDHPNIAKVLDAGATDTGRPFFVMELVRGVPITEYCDQNNLSPQQRLELFIPVCKAIQHAHQKGIIHRDIKPSNILVTLHDGVPVPKVIDFGIAKAIDQPLTEKTLFTRFEQFMGTPAYMSPEQAEMSGLDIDTRSDIYALGVLLYELLTGKPPFDPDTLVKSGIEAIRKTIREVEPPRPSTRLSTLAAADLTAIAKKRGTEPARLSALVHGDLDWIVMKCLEKDRTHRYETASGLAVDVQHYLDNEPVIARPPSSLYRFQKLVRRNKLVCIATAGITLALVLGTTISIWQALRAEAARAAQADARKHAETEALRAKQAQMQAEQRLADNLVAHGDALASAQHWDQARDLYREAETAFQKLGLSTFLTRVAAWETYRRSPPPLSSLAAHRTPSTDVRFLPDGLHALSISSDGVIREWDVRLGISTRSEHCGSNSCAAISNDGERILIGSEPGDLTLWDSQHGQALRTWSGHNGKVECVAVSFDGRFGASGGSDGLVKCWDLTTGQVLSSVIAHHGPVRCLAISPDGRWAVSGGKDMTAVVWELASGRMLHRFTSHGDQVFGVAFSPDGKQVLSGSGDFYTAGRGTVLALWNIDTGSVRRTFEGHPSGVSSVAFSSDGYHVLSGGWDGSVRLWDIGVGRELQTVCAHKDGVCRVAFSSDGNRFLSADINGVVHIWSTKESADLRACPRFEGKVQTAAVSPDGRMALAGSRNGARSRLKLWDVATARQLCGWKHDAEVRSVAISPDSRYCLAGLGNGNVALHDPASESDVYPFSAHSGAVESVMFSSDTEKFLSAGEDGYVRLWDTIRRRDLREFVQRGALRTVRFSPDNLLCAAAGEGPELSVWNLASGNRQSGFPTQQGEIKSVAWSADGQRLLSASYDKSIKIWDLHTQHEILNIALSEPVFAGIFGPEDQCAFTGHYLGGINIWEVSTGRLLRTLLAHGSSAMALAASANWSVLVSAGWDGDVQLWDFSRVSDYAKFEPRLAKARQMLAADSNDPQALADLGEWYAFRDAPDWAIDLLEQARSLGAAVPSLTLARCYWQLNDYESARREFQIALNHKEASQSYLRLCLSAVMKPVVGYHIDNDEVVFEFEPAVQGMKLAPDAEVLLAGEFNRWLDNANGSITNSYPQWVMQRIDDGRYMLRKKIADLRGQSQWQFRFVVDRNQWVEVPDASANRDESGGMANLIVRIPPPRRKSSTAQN